jgi:hypothetical protein
MLARIARTAVRGNPRSVVARIRTDDKQILRVRLGHLSQTSLEPGSLSPIALELRHETGRWRFEGAEAMRVASTLMPKVNRYGGTKQTIARAVSELEEQHGSEGYLVRLSQVARITTRPPMNRVRFGIMHDLPDAGLFGLTPVQRLAFEMALHEEAERRAMEGELAELERAWREAEEIAAISDNLLIPPGVEQQLERIHETSLEPRSTKG